ncbi:hypothetical protein DRQ53_11665, partial [bacterium]
MQARTILLIKVTGQVTCRTGHLAPDRNARRETGVDQELGGARGGAEGVRRILGAGAGAVATICLVLEPALGVAAATAGRARPGAISQMLQVESWLPEACSSLPRWATKATADSPRATATKSESHLWQRARMAITPALEDPVNLCTWARPAKSDQFGIRADFWYDPGLILSRPGAPSGSAPSRSYPRQQTRRALMNQRMVSAIAFASFLVLAALVFGIHIPDDAPSWNQLEQQKWSSRLAHAEQGSWAHAKASSKLQRL